MRVRFEKIAAPGRSFLVRKIAARNFTAPLHAHPEFELTLITHGRGRRLVGETLEEFGPGDLVLVGSNQPHRWTSEMTAARQGARAWVVQFHADCLGPEFFSRVELARVDRLLRRVRGGLHFRASLAARLERDFATLAQARGVDLVCEFLRLLAVLAEAPARSLPAARTLPAGRSEARGRIERVIDALERRYAEPGLSLADVARVAAMHPSACSRFFSRTTGQTVMAYLKQVRVGHACRLLGESSRPITEIAFDCGFGTISNFNRCFRQLRGRSPREYRRQLDTPPHRIARHFTEAPA